MVDTLLGEQFLITFRSADQLEHGDIVLMDTLLYTVDRIEHTTAEAHSLDLITGITGMEMVQLVHIFYLGLDVRQVSLPATRFAVVLTNGEAVSDTVPSEWS